ncbi:ribosomal protein S18 acetylase RimI-like enzyme [Frigoribacterium sp. UYMn621]
MGWASTKYFPDVDGDAPAGHYLMGITVAPKSRRLGVARSLITARLSWISQVADNAFYFASSMNQASIGAHEPWNFHEIARAHQFRGVPFASGEGILFQAALR